MYSICSRSSFEEVTSIYDQIRRIKGVDKIALVLVGNKSDLEDTREVAAEAGMSLAYSWEAGFYETSAMAKTNISEAIHHVVREITERSNALDQFCVRVTREGRNRTCIIS